MTEIEMEMAAGDAFEESLDVFGQLDAQGEKARKEFLNTLQEWLYPGDEELLCIIGEMLGRATFQEEDDTCDLEKRVIEALKTGFGVAVAEYLENR